MVISLISDYVHDRRVLTFQKPETWRSCP